MAFISEHLNHSPPQVLRTRSFCPSGSGRTGRFVSESNLGSTASGSKFLSGVKYDDDFDFQPAREQHRRHERGGGTQPRYYRFDGSVLSVVGRQLLGRRTAAVGRLVPERADHLESALLSKRQTSNWQTSPSVARHPASVNPTRFQLKSKRGFRGRNNFSLRTLKPRGCDCQNGWLHKGLPRSC